MKLIALTQGFYAKVDEENFEALQHFRWRAVQSFRSYYAKTTIFKKGKRIDICMHRFICRCPAGFIVHHLDGDSLNNQRDNLQIMVAKTHDLYCRQNHLQIKFDRKTT